MSKWQIGNLGLPILYAFARTKSFRDYRKYRSCLSMVSYLRFPIQIINASYVTVILNCMEMILIEVANVFLTAAYTQLI